MDLLDTTFTSNSNLTTMSNNFTTTSSRSVSGLVSATDETDNITNQLIPDRYKTFTMDFITNFNNDNMFKINGWFKASRNVTKYLKNGLAKCLHCYIRKQFNQQSYVRILNVTENSGSESFDRVVCICNDCVSKINQCNGKVKQAPRTYHDVLLDYLINEKYDLLLSNIEKIGGSLNGLQEKIDYLRFNINEKVVLLNNLTNENEKLSKNLDIEIEKHKLFFDHKNKNNELIKRFKKQFNDLSIELFRENKKTLDEHINKYQELNQVSKYSIPECRICMQNEVKIALQCGHLLCHFCYNKLQNDSKQNENEIDGQHTSSSDIVCCPLCRTYCNTYTQIYF